MLNIKFKKGSCLQRFLSEQGNSRLIQTASPEERVKLLVVRDLLRLGWEMNFEMSRALIKPPNSYNKQVVKDSMQMKRQESLTKNATWIERHSELAQQNLADGCSVWKSRIEPRIEVCKTQEQFDTFRMFRYYWSSPYSEYVGRRIKLLIRDYALPSRPLIGIAALGSSIIHIPDRDEWIGWATKTRTKNLIYTMDAYVLGALPPYNYLLGGKLISYLIASNEVRDIYSRKYKGKVTNVSKRKANQLACVFTTSLYGKSSQYNRLKYEDNLLYVPIGYTKGYGTLHLTDETFTAMRDLLKSHNVLVTNKFGDGPLWRMRVIRTAAEILNFEADFLLKHSFARKVYVVPLARNYKEFLNGEHIGLQHTDYPLTKLVNYWKRRWLKGRKMNQIVKRNVFDFRATDFRIV